MSQRKFQRGLNKAKSKKKEKETGSQHQPSVQAMVWYKEEDWDTLKQMFVDSHLLPENYQDWLARAEEMKEKVQAQGDIAMKVFIDPETFPEWCKKKNMKMDAEARSTLAIEVAQAQSFSL